MNRQQQLASAGFTLMEIVVVVAIIALLAGIAIPLVADRVDDAKLTRATADMDQIAKAMNAFKLDTNRWPHATTAYAPASLPTASTTFQTHTALFVNPNIHNWKGPYMNEPVIVGGTTYAAYINGNDRRGYLDPWGNFYNIYQVARTNSFAGFIALVSAGPDGNLSTTQASARAGRALGDDLIKIVTRKL